MESKVSPVYVYLKVAVSVMSIRCRKVGSAVVVCNATIQFLTHCGDVSG